METIIEKDNVKLEIGFYKNPYNPRDIFEPLTKMVCFHGRYNLGDKHDYNHNDYDNWDEMLEDIIRKENPICIKPLYLYDHSGITISTSSFCDRWDSGQVGFIFIRKEDIKKEFGKKRITKELKERSEKMIECEVKEYDDYLRGDVYYMKLYENDEEVDSFGEFYGDNFWTNGMSDNLNDDIQNKLYDELVKEFGKKKI